MDEAGTGAACDALRNLDALLRLHERGELSPFAPEHHEEQAA